MTLWQAILLGLIQGITEFFPVSSSAHLKIAKHLFGVQETQSLHLFDLYSHFGTLLALLVFLRQDILKIGKDSKLRLNVFLALIPLVPAYFMLKPFRVWASQESFLGYWLMVTSLLLALSQKAYKPKPTDKFSSLFIGTMQTLALIPGISRSASTIFGGRIFGFSAKEAVRFSFILSIPTIGGGLLLEVTKAGFNQQLLMPTFLFPSLGGCFAAFFSGLICVRYALQTLEKGFFKPFAWYCLLLGLVISIFEAI